MIQHLPLLVSVAAGLPDAKSSESIGWLIAAGGAAVTAIGTILVFLRREARMKEPPQERRVHGGPLTIRQEGENVPRHEHNDFKTAVEHHQSEIWKVINGMRKSISHIENDVSGLRALREANGERLAEMSGDVKTLSALVHKLAGIVETKMEAKHK